MTKKNKKFRRAIFPIGIFLLLLIILSAITTGGATAYFLHTGKKQIAIIEKYTKSYATVMAEGFADLASYSIWTKRYIELRKLFHNEIKAATIDEAFVVLNNGTLIVHSNKNIEKKLKGNIATDEFAYNIEWILRPSIKKTREIQLTAYNVMGKIIPFYREERNLIKKYLYKDINLTGWLVSKAIYVKGKPVGTVSFIIYRDRIYDYIESHIELSKKIIISCLIGSFILSLFFSFIILIRYRSLQKKAFNMGIKETRDTLSDLYDKDIDISEASDFNKDQSISRNDVNQTVVFSSGGSAVKAKVETKEKNLNDDESITIDLTNDMKPENENEEIITIDDSSISLETIVKPDVEEDTDFWGKTLSIKEGIPVNEKAH